MLQPVKSKIKNVLILQSDWEGGLSNLAIDLITAGKHVTKVLLHAGDWIYKWKKVPTVVFDAPLDQWESWLREYIKEHKIDTLILYNQYRPYNAVGWDIAKELKLECIVLELGLIRPDFCSMYSRERNQFEYLKAEWDVLLKSGEELNGPTQPWQWKKMSTPKKMTQFALFFLISRFFSVILRQYPHYRDQRTMSVCHHLIAGVKSLILFCKRKKEFQYSEKFKGIWSGKYYIVPLQVHTDSQITKRSNFSSIEEFIEMVMTSFYKYAPKDTKLIFKVHPMDRGYRDYRKFIEGLRKKTADERRVFYLDRIHLPTALDHARACITINSSVGLSALIHKTPLLTLGEAAFDLNGLTYKGELDQFWKNHGEVNQRNILNFLALLKHTSQAKGTLYQRLYDVPGKCRIKWPYIFQNALFGYEFSFKISKKLKKKKIKRIR